MLRKFKLHWLHGDTEEIEAKCDKTLTSDEACAMAMNQAGIGAGALQALDYWEEIT